MAIVYTYVSLPEGSRVVKLKGIATGIEFPQVEIWGPTTIINYGVL